MDMWTNYDMTYVYDGTLEGLYTCVFRCYEDKYIPCAVVTQNTLTPCAPVFTDKVKAARVKRGVFNKMGTLAADMIYKAFLSDFEDKELAVIRFIVYGMKAGHAASGDLAHPDVARMYEIYRAVNREARMTAERLVFSLTGGLMVAIVEPSHNVLPLIVKHFTQRYPNDEIFIYDKVHKLGATWSHARVTFNRIEHFEPDPADEEEETYRRLWQIFYDAVEIKERHNPRLRDMNMPIRHRRKF